MGGGGEECGLDKTIVPLISYDFSTDLMMGGWTGLVTKCQEGRLARGILPNPIPLCNKVEIVNRLKNAS